MAARVDVVATDRAGHAATAQVDVELSGGPLDPFSRLRGVAVLHQIGSVGTTPSSAASTIQSLRSSMLSACATPGVTMLSLRFPRTALYDSGGNFDARAIDAGYQVAQDAGVVFVPRYMDGRHMPTAQMGVTVTDSVGSWPRPWDNPAYLDGVSAVVGSLSDWLVARSLPELHTSWPAREWAELNNGIEVRSVAGYTVEKLTAFHEDVVDRIDQALSPLVVPELPLSGYGPVADYVSPHLIDHMVASGRPWVFQANGWSNSPFHRVWGAPQQSTENTFNANVLARRTPLVEFAIQDIGLGSLPTANWPEMTEELQARGAIAAEVYLNRWTPPEPGLVAQVAVMFP